MEEEPPGWRAGVDGVGEALELDALIEMVDHLCRRLNLGGAFHDEVW